MTSRLGVAQHGILRKHESVVSLLASVCTTIPLDIHKPAGVSKHFYHERVLNYIECSSHAPQDVDG